MQKILGSNIIKKLDFVINTQKSHYNYFKIYNLLLKFFLYVELLVFTKEVN